MSEKITKPDNAVKDSKLHCSAEWHLARLKPECAAVVYTQALHLAHTSENYYCSTPQMAAYFDKNERTIGRAFKKLVAVGLFEVIRREKGKAVNYRPVPHKEWSEKHPDQCVEKLAMPWDGEGDPLGAALFAVSGARVGFFPNVLKGLRKHGFSDEEIIREWKQFIVDQEYPRPTTKWKGIVRHFNESLSMKKLYYESHAN